MQILITPYVIQSMTAERGLGSAAGGLLASALFAGMLLGSWSVGVLTDSFSRKAWFIVTVLASSILSLMSAFAYGLVVALLRVATGFALGGTMLVSFAYFSEHLPSKNRGRWLVVLESFWAVGTILAVVMAWLILPRFTEGGWRYLFGLSAIP